MTHKLEYFHFKQIHTRRMNEQVYRINVKVTSELFCDNTSTCTYILHVIYITYTDENSSIKEMIIHSITNVH